MKKLKDLFTNSKKKSPLDKMLDKDMKRLHPDLVEHKTLIRDVHEKLHWEISKNRANGPIEDSVRGLYIFLNDNKTKEYYRQLGDKLDEYPDDLKSPNLLFSVIDSICDKFEEAKNTAYAPQFVKILGMNQHEHKLIDPLPKLHKEMLLLKLGNFAKLFEEEDKEVNAFKVLNQKGFMSSLAKDADSFYISAFMQRCFNKVNKEKIADVIYDTPFMNSAIDVIMGRADDSIATPVPDKVSGPDIDQITPQ